MDKTIAVFKSRVEIKTLLFDLFVFAAITLIPAVSHMFSLPVYYIEPMRIMLILGIVHTSRKNSYLLALAIPVISVLVSGHPAVVKSLLIFAELSLNVWLFTVLGKIFKNTFAVAFGSIILSKVFYYTVKIALLSTALLEGSLVATPIYLQVIVAAVLSLYAYLILERNSK